MIIKIDELSEDQKETDEKFKEVKAKRKEKFDQTFYGVK